MRVPGVSVHLIGNHMRKHDRADYKHEDHFDEHGNYRDPGAQDRKSNGDSRGGWVN